MRACTQLMLSVSLYRAKPVTEPKGEVSMAASAWNAKPVTEPKGEVGKAARAWNAKPVTDAWNPWGASLVRERAEQPQGEVSMAEQKK